MSKRTKKVFRLAPIGLVVLSVAVFQILAISGSSISKVFAEEPALSDVEVPTSDPVVTEQPAPSDSPEFTPTASPEEPTPSDEPVVSETPRPEGEARPEGAAEETPTVTPEATPSETPIETVEPTPSETPTEAPRPEGEARPEGAAEPSIEPSIEPIPEASVSPEPSPVVDGNIDLNTFLLTPSPTPSSSPMSTPVLSTDKADYQPGETVSIFGQFFNSLQNIILKIFGGSPDNGTYTETTQNVTADEQGNFTTTYSLDNIYRPLYNIIAQSTEGTLLAQTSFTDTNTSVLVPISNGTYTAWENGYAEVDETSSFSCSSGDYIRDSGSTTGNGQKESFNINLSSVPDGSTITSIQVNSYSRDESSGGNGTFQTLIIFNGTEAASGSNISPADASTCAGPNAQNFDVIDTVKGVSTTLQIGVVKTNSGSQVRVGALNTIITYTDTTPPTVSSSVRVGTDPTNASSVQFTVTFSESVTGVDTADFSLTTTGSISGASVSSVSGSGAIRTVTVNTGTGDGTIRLDVTDNDTIIDGDSNPLGGIGAGNGNYTSGQVYTIDTTPLTVTIDQAVGQTDPTGASSINFAVVFNKFVSDFDGTDVTISGTAGTAPPETATVTDMGDGKTYKVAISGMTSGGTVIINLPVGIATDAAGNSSVAPTIIDNQVTYQDTTAPTLAQVTPIPSLTNDNTPNYTFSSSEAGTITYGGDCSSASTVAIVGNNMVTFSALSDGAHTNCTITVTDADANASNPLSVNSFTVDTTAPSTSDNAPTAWRNTDASVTLTASDGSGSGVASTKYCTYNSGSPACTPTTTYTVPISVTCPAASVCTQIVRYFSTDNVGIAETAHNSGTIQIDKIAPSDGSSSGSPTGPNNSGTGADLSGVGSIIWSSPENIVSDNNSYASAVLPNSSAISHYLSGTNYSFSIPSGATINGIRVTIGRYASNITGTTRIQDNVVQLIKAGSIVGSNRAVTGNWPTSKNVATYGGAADLWGTTWTPEDINNSNFGVGLSIKNVTTMSNSYTGYVDYMQITVYYTYTPTVNAGPDKTTNAIFTQTGIATDIGSGIATYSWTKDSGSGNITFGTPNAIDTTISADAIGAYVIKFTVTDVAGNSNFDTMTLNWEATPPVVTLDPVDQTITYGADATFTASASGIPAPTVKWQESTDGGSSFADLPGETNTSLTIIKPAVSASGYKYRAVFTNIGGSVETTAATLTVNKASQTITFNTLPNKTYGDADFGISASASSGLTVTFSALNECSIIGNTVHITGAGSCTITASQSGNGNYNTATPVDQIFSIDKADAIIMVTGYTGIYDAASHGATGTATGAKGEDLGSLLHLGSAFTDVPGGTADWTFDGDSNYNSDSGSVSITIGKADAVISVIPYGVDYDGNPHTATGSAKGIADVVLSGLDLSGTEHTNAGSYATDPWTFTDVTGNYNDDSGIVSDTINKIDATVTVNGWSGTYDGDAHGATGTATGVGGAPITGLDLGSSFTNVPGGTAHWTFTGGTNYIDESGDVAIDISKADALINISGWSGTYDGDAHGASIVTATGVKGEDLTGSVDLGSSFIDVPGGTAHWTFAGGTNYINESGDKDIIISKADASCLISGYSGVYDNATHGASGSCPGVGGESAGSLDLGATYKDVPGGSAHWALTGNVNYNDASGDVAIDISKADASLLVNGYTGIYDAASHGASLDHATGVGGVDLSSGITLGLTYTNVPGGTAHWTFAGGTNYNDASGDVAIDISKANAVIQVNEYHVFYDGDSHTATGSATGVLDETLNGLDLTATTHTTAGDYTGDAWIFTDVTGNYNDASGTVDDSIEKIDATINVTGYTGIYDGNAHGATGTAIGTNGEDLNSLLHLGDSFTNVPGGIAYWTFDGDTNYNPANGDKTITINKADALVSITGYDVAYDGIAHTATGTATGKKGESLAGLDLSGTTHTDAATYLGDPWSFTDVTGNYIDQSDTVDDSISSAAASITITPYDVTYNGDPHTATVEATGAQGEDLSAFVDLSDTTHTNAGTYATDAWSFHVPTGNYADANGTVSDAISKADPTIVVTPYSVPFDGSSHTADGSAKGVKGEALTGLDLSGTTHTNAGSYAIDPWTFTDVTGNYINKNDIISDSIGKINATITVNGYSGVYDAAAHGATGSVTGLGGVPLAGLDLGLLFTDVPGGTAHWTFTDVTGDYNDASGDIDITISKADATCTVTGYSGIYDVVAHGASGSCSGIGGENAGTLDLGTTYTDVPGGTAHWVFTGNGNYNDQSGDVDIVIGKADATIIVNSYNGIYDGDPDGATGTATGVNGEDLGAMLDLGATYTNVPGGTAHWAFNGGTNYNNDEGDVAIVISKADANIVVTPYSVFYDGIAHTATGTVTGAKGEGLSGLDLSKTTHTNAGDYTDPWTFTDAAGNYKDASDTIADSIGKNALIITANNANKTYGDTLTFAGTEFTPSGLLGSDNVSNVTLTSTGAAAGAAVGSYNIVPSSAVGTGLTNYNIFYSNGTLTVGQRAITLTADAKSKTEGQKDPALTYQVTNGSLVGTDAFSGNLGRVGGEAAGTYLILQNSLNAGSNYNLTYIGALLTINPLDTGGIEIQKTSIGGVGTFHFTGLNGDAGFDLTTQSVGIVAETYFDVAPGTYTVTEQVPSGWTVNQPSCQVTVGIGQIATCAFVNTYQTTPPSTGKGKISGTKYEDGNGDGKINGTDSVRRLSGWTIFLDTNDNGVLDNGEKSTNTNWLGQYSFSNLPSGTYHVREVLKSGWIGTVPSGGKYDINLGVNQNVSGKNFANFKLGTISGMKFEDKNGNGRKDRNENGLAGWTIQLKQGNSLVAQVVTGNDGKYSFTGLGSGKYKVTEVPQTNWQQKTRDPAQITINSGTSDTDNNFGNQKTK